MNKELLGLVFVVVWLAGLTFMMFKPSPKLFKTENSVIRYVQGDSLQTGLNLIKELEATLQQNVQEADSLLKAQAAPLQKEAQELIAYANSGNATLDEMQIAQTRVYELEMVLQQLQAAAEQEVIFQEQTMQTTVAEFLDVKLANYAEENNIDLILNWGLSGEGVLYGTAPLDITAEVLEALNATEE